MRKTVNRNKEIMELAEKNFKIYITYIFNDLKEHMNIIKWKWEI